MIKVVTLQDLECILQAPQSAIIPPYLSSDAAAEARNFHAQLPGYKPTPLVSLRNLAASWGLRGIFVKDESHRFGLKAFKVLGGSFAAANLVCRLAGQRPGRATYAQIVGEQVREKIGRITLATATDGNHGRGVAWAAEQLGQKAVVYMPKGAAPSRVSTIEDHGAEVIVTDLNYYDTVRMAREMAEKNGWHVVQDTAWEGYTEIPRWIMQGYLTMCAEAADQLETRGAVPTHVFIQAGVGALAGAVVGHLSSVYRRRRPRFIVMEPKKAACIYASVAAGDGKPHAVKGDLETIMAGLACGEPNPLSWEILRELPSAYISCADFVAANGIRILANPLQNDPMVEAGESGSVGPGLLDLLSNRPDLFDMKADLDIDSNSVCLFFNTEGATDPQNYRDILWYGKYPRP